jgi:hypothetical protein
LLPVIVAEALVSPPGRDLNIRKYQDGKRKKGIVYLQVPNNKRRRNQKSFLRSLGPLTAALGNPRRTKRLRNSELIYRLGKIFA